ncbi:MAG: type VI secretion system-associated protein TagF [Polyangiaceae bacterium]|nr:type VI secretion system-associated protein TagF [Polyangiaceae bacterium]
MFWRNKKREPPVVACYGKLPATGDFIRYNASFPVLSQFDRWMQGSLSLARDTLGAAFDGAYRPSVGLFIYRGEDERGEPPSRGLVGVWAASGDSAGRQYPMVACAAYDYAELVATGAALPIAMWPFLTAAYELCTQGRGLGVDEFLGRAARLQPPSLEVPEAASAGYRQWLERQPMKGLWETSFGSVEWRYWVMHLVAASVEVFQGQERPNTNLGIRFPLGAGDAYAAAVWMDITTRLARWRGTLLNAFWAPQRSLVLHMGPPHVGTFRELIAPSGDTEYITDLCQAPTVDEHTARSRLGPRLGALVDGTDATLATFLQALG